MQGVISRSSHRPEGRGVVALPYPNVIRERPDKQPQPNSHRVKGDTIQQEEEMGRYDNKNVLVTGASSGIGKALALEFARQGANLIITARRKERLDDLAKEIEGMGRKALAVACDVTLDGDMERAVEETHEAFGLLDVVVANAGFGVSGNLEKLKVEDYKRQNETNVYGLLRTVYATLDDLKQTKGRLALVGSVASYVSMPGSTPYSISKYAVRALAEGLYLELKPKGVSVTLVSPGFVSSEIRQVNNKGVLKEGAKDPVPQWIVLSAEVAARQIANGIFSRKREQVITWHGRLIMILRNHFPWLYWFITGFIKRSGDKK